MAKRQPARRRRGALWLAVAGALVVLVSLPVIWPRLRLAWYAWFPPSYPPIALPLAGERLETGPVGPITLALKDVAGRSWQSRSRIDTTLVMFAGGRVQRTHGTQEQAAQARVDRLDVGDKLLMTLSRPKGRFSATMDDAPAVEERFDNPDMVVEVELEPTGRLGRIRAIRSDDPKLRDKLQINNERARLGGFLLFPARPVGIGETWPSGRREFGMVGSGTLAFEETARLAGLGRWRGEAVAVLDIAASAPRYEPDPDLKGGLTITGFALAGRVLVSLRTGLPLTQVLQVDARLRAAGPGAPDLMFVHVTAAVDDELEVP